MLRGEESVRAVDVAAVRAVYLVSMADGLFHGEETFAVTVFPGEIWVVPESTPGYDDFWRACRAAAAGYFEAVTPGIPWAWRKRVWGLPLFPTPRLWLATDGVLPVWTVRRRVDE